MLSPQILCLDYLFGDKDCQHLPVLQGPESIPTIVIIKIWDSFWLFLFLTYVVVWSPTLCQDLCDDPCWTYFLLLS